MSEKARRKLNRSGSQSSSEHSQDGRLSPEPPHFTIGDPSASPANRRKPERPPPPGPGAPSNKEPGSKSNFFDTLEWQQDSEGLLGDNDEGTEWKSTSRQRFDSVEDEFGQLSMGRVKSAAGENGAEHNFFNERPRDGAATVPEGNFFEADFSGANEKRSDTVQTGDLLNMSGSNAQNAANGVNLLDTEAPEPSNLELLTGAADLRNTSDTKASLVGDTFDPFSDMSAAQPQRSSKQNAFDLLGSDAGNAQQKPANFDAFDLLGNSAADKTKPAACSSDNFLFMDSGSSKAQTNTKQEDNLLGFGGMNLNLNATSPGFGGSNPNLSSYAKGQQQQQSKAADTQPSPAGLKDPFAEFGTSGEILCNVWVHTYLLAAAFHTYLTVAAVKLQEYVPPSCLLTATLSRLSSEFCFCAAGNFGPNKSKSMTSMASAAKSPTGGSPMHMGAGMGASKLQPAWSPTHQPNYGKKQVFLLSILFRRRGILRVSFMMQ